MKELCFDTDLGSENLRFGSSIAGRPDDTVVANVSVLFDVSEMSRTGLQKI